MSERCLLFLLEIHPGDSLCDTQRTFLMNAGRTISEAVERMGWAKMESKG